MDVFAIQEKVIEHILGQVQEQRAIEEAPTTLDPAQQAVATALRLYMNHPDVDRQEARRLVQALAKPLPGVHVRALKAAYQEFGRIRDVTQLVAAVQALPLGAALTVRDSRGAVRTIGREDLHLVCFDFVWS